MAKILIVEDNAANMKLACLLLLKAGHTALCAMDAETGLMMASADQPDLILMDLLMPQMTGLEAVGLMRQTPELASTVVLALTALAFDHERKLAMDAGFDLVITKPFSRRQLMAAISERFPRLELTLPEVRHDLRARTA